jgi:hypothetical protein
MRGLRLQKAIFSIFPQPVKNVGDLKLDLLAFISVFLTAACNTLT